LECCRPIATGSVLIFTWRRTVHVTGSTGLAQIFGYDIYDVLIKVFINGEGMLFGVRADLWTVLVTLLLFDRSPLTVTQCTACFYKSFGTLNSTRRTRGHCLEPFRAVNVSDSSVIIIIIIIIIIINDDDNNNNEKETYMLTCLNFRRRM
jgi:hypothetical protein